LDWTKEEGSQVPTAAVSGLIKETVTLHKVLSQILPNDQVTVSLFRKRTNFFKQEHI
jgi:hypothetical protein